MVVFVVPLVLWAAAAGSQTLLDEQLQKLPISSLRTAPSRSRALATTIPWPRTAPGSPGADRNWATTATCTSSDAAAGPAAECQLQEIIDGRIGEQRVSARIQSLQQQLGLMRVAMGR